MKKKLPIWVKIKDYPPAKIYIESFKDLSDLAKAINTDPETAKDIAGRMTFHYTADGEAIEPETTIEEVLSEMSSREIRRLIVRPFKSLDLEPIPYWKVTGRVKNSLSVIGVRSRLYNAVDTHLGYYEEGVPSFTYEGSDLLVNVLFKFEQNALRFESSLRNESINLKSPLNNLEVSTEVSSSSSVRLGGRVFFTDYVQSDSDSPQFTQPVSTDIFSVFEETSDEFKYQRIERLAVFGKRGKAESCHLMSSSHCKKYVTYKDYDLDASNRLALSRDMHGWFDALSCEIPLFWLDVKEVSTKPVLEGRYKVDLVLKSYDKEAAEMIFWRLKDGSEREKEDDLVIYTQVLVQNPKLFKDCLQWKKNQIEKRWKEYENMAPAVP